jgi:hypothetical protein
LLKVVRALEAAVWHGVDRQLAERQWRALLGDAKQTRDDHASRRTLGVNRNRGLAAERRARSIDATTAALEALGSLRDLQVNRTGRRNATATQESSAVRCHLTSRRSWMDGRRGGTVL